MSEPELAQPAKPKSAEVQEKPAAVFYADVWVGGV